MLYIIGDIHGHYCDLVKLLKRDTDLIDDDLHWSGGYATLVLMGDYVDRGPAGIETIDFIMTLQQQAAAAGGQVIALLGNHDISLLAAYHFRDERRKRQPRAFLEDWKRYGGQMNDLDRLTMTHIRWLTHLPAMVMLDDLLLVHADSMLYTRYGDSVTEVNKAITAILRGDELTAWDNLIEDFGEKFAFKPGILQNLRTGKADKAQQFLQHFGGSQIIHGHTPVYRMTNQAAKDVTAALVYSGGLAVNVDPCLYNNGPGFVYAPVTVMMV